MKHRFHFYLGTIFLFVLFAGTLSAQQNLTLPDVSQHATVTQEVGLTEIAIDYHRPGVKGRKLWGALVPYDQVWRAGANQNTTISFSKDAIIDGRTVPAGIYGLHMIPTEKDWTIILSRDYRAWGSFFYNEGNDLMRFTVTPEACEFQEWLLYSFDVVTPNSTTASLKWGKMKIPFEIKIDLHKQVIEDIKIQLTGLPGFFWQAWNQAANYCYVNTYDLEQGLKWADRSITINKTAANMFTKALILADLNKTDEANELKNEAFSIATENELNTLGYQLMNGGKIDIAIEVFTKNTELNPDSWNVWDSLAEGYMNKGENKLAVEYYTKALGMAPENQKARIQGLLNQLSEN